MALLSLMLILNYSRVRIPILCGSLTCKFVPGLHVAVQCHPAARLTLRCAVYEKRLERAIRCVPVRLAPR